MYFDAFVSISGFGKISIERIENPGEVTASRVSGRSFKAEIMADMPRASLTVNGICKTKHARRQKP
jgi:hypothetical protein